MPKHRIKKPKRWPKLHPDVVSGAAAATVPDVAVALRLCVNTIWEMKAAGTITPMKLPGPVRFHLPSVRKELGVEL